MYKKCMDMLEKILMIIIGILMGIMVVVLTYQVILRYGFARATPWAEEVAKYSLIWLVMLATPVGFRRYRHICIDVFSRHFPPKVKIVVDTFINLLLIVFLGFLCYYTVGVCISIRGQLAQSSGIPMNAVYFSAAVGSFFSILVLIEIMYDQITAFRNREEGEKA